MDLVSGDIEAGAHLASRIHHDGFLEENAADVSYKNFQNDIFNFRGHLERLHEALQNAQQRYVDRGRSQGILGYEPLSEDFETERKTFVGDFVATLKACDALLEDNKKIRLRYNNDLENLSGQLAQQEQRVAYLRSRLYLHSEKIRYALDRLSIDFLTNLDADVGSSLTITERNLLASSEMSPDLDRQFAEQRRLTGSPSEHVHAVSAAIASKFQEYLLVDPPPGFESGLPLIQTFDALLLSLQQSNTNSDQTPEKYLLFLKTRWLLDRIKKSNGYQAACSAFYYKRAVNQVEQAILARIRRPGDLISYDESILMKLPSSLFRIWPPLVAAPAAKTTLPHPLMARANEQKIVCINLVSDDQADPDTVTVFKSSDTRFRIVMKGAELDGRILTAQTVYCVEDKLIPRYALPTVADPNPEMAIFSRNEETLYKFQSFRDLYSFQTALTGFDVSHDQADIRCQFSDDLSFLDCVGRLQLWQEPITLSPGTDADDLYQHRSLRTQNSFVEGTHSRRDSVIPSVAPTNTVSWTTGGWEAENIKLPTITIFTQLVDNRQRPRFAIISIALERGIYIDHTECGCCREYRTCSKLVLTREKKRSFSVRVLYSSNIDGTGQLNPNTFDIFPFRLPRHPGFHKMITKQTEYLVLKFRTLPEKQSFHRELDLRFRVRDKQIADQRDFTNRIRHRQNRPQGRQSLFAQTPSFLSSPSLFSFEASLPPILDVPDTGPTLADTFANSPDSTSCRQGLNGNRPVAIPPTPRSISSGRRAESMCTSLDSMVVPTSHVERIDRYLVGDTKPILTPETASSVYSATYGTVGPKSSTGFEGVPNDVTYALQEHQEFYAPEIRTEPRLARSPSSVAPERYNPDTLSGKTYEPAMYNIVSSRDRSPSSISPQSPMMSGGNGYQTPPYGDIPQLPRTQSAAAPEWYHPDSITASNIRNRPNQYQQMQTSIAPIRHEYLGMQNESTISRSKTGRRKGNFLSKLLQK